MATQADQDPLDEEIEGVLGENPQLRERLAEYDRKRRQAGELTLIRERRPAAA